MIKQVASLLSLSGLLLGASLASQQVHAAPPAIAADPARGKILYQQRCAICHSLEAGKSKIGPSLAGVSGRRAGTQNFAYSPAMRSSKLVWNVRQLTEFLEAPAQKIPGTKMVTKLPNANDRADVAAFLQNAR